MSGKTTLGMPCGKDSDCQSNYCPTVAPSEQYIAGQVCLSLPQPYGQKAVGDECVDDNDCLSKLCRGHVQWGDTHYTTCIASPSPPPPPPTCNPASVTMPPKVPKTQTELDLLNECAYARATNTDQALLFACQCLQTLESEENTFRAYQNAINLYACDKTNYDAYLALKDVWNSLRNEKKADIERERFSECVDKGSKCEDANPEYTLDTARSKDECTGAVTGGGRTTVIQKDLLTCKYNDMAVQTRLRAWEAGTPPPPEVYAPQTPSVFRPGNVQCCSQVWQNVDAGTSNVQFNNIRQQCVTTISESLKKVPTSQSTPTPLPTAPTSPTSPTSPSPYPSPTSPTPPSSSPTLSKTMTIIVGSAIGILVLLLIGLLWKKKSNK
jgi:hypothetical protein